MSFLFNNFKNVAGPNWSYFNSMDIAIPMCHMISVPYLNDIDMSIKD